MNHPINTEGPVVTADGEFTEAGKHVIQWIADLVNAEALKTADPVAYRNEFLRRFLDGATALGRAQ